MRNDAQTGHVPERLYHGGVAGLRVGDLIVPHPPKFHDGCPACEANRRGESHPVSPLTRHPDHVYVTSHRLYSLYYASLWGLGDCYRIQPVGAVVPSTEDAFPTWRCEAARVAGIVSRAVRLTDHQRRTLWRQWGAADRAAALSR